MSLYSPSSNTLTSPRLRSQELVTKMTPLHTAASKPSPPSLITLMIRLSDSPSLPPLASYQNAAGFTPLHNAAACSCAASETFRALIRSHPPSLSARSFCRHGRTPLSVLSLFSPSPKSLSLSLLAAATAAFESGDYEELARVVGGESRAIDSLAAPGRRIAVLLSLASEGGGREGGEREGEGGEREGGGRRRELDVEVARGAYRRCGDVWSVILGFL